jgi:hypothetical protein
MQSERTLTGADKLTRDLALEEVTLSENDVKHRLLHSLVESKEDMKGIFIDPVPWTLSWNLAPRAASMRI